MREETFGPLLPVMRVARAPRRRCASPTIRRSGLSGSVWSADAAKARALARRLETGSVCVNDALFNYFCVEAPLGGVKASGIGFRHGPEGLRQFCRDRDDRRGPSAARLAVAVRRRAARRSPIRRRTQRLLRRFMRLFY